MTTDRIPPKILPKILIDARMVGEIPHGIARYVTYLAQALAEIRNRSPLPYEPLFLVDSEFETIRPNHPIGEFQVVPAEAPFLNPRELLEIPKILKSLGACLYHSPSFSSLFHSPCPWIVTIHDLNHLTFGSFSKKLYYQFLLKRFARRSKAIITVSQFSREELAKWLGLSAEAIQIVFNVIKKPADPQTQAAESSTELTLRRFQLKKGEYFLCLSNSKPHKNVPLLLEAYQQFSRQQKGAWPLVVTVRPEDFGSIRSSTKGIRPVGGLSDGDSKILLRNAGGMVFPSLYEGFGLPPVEAAVLGIPLAVSHIPAHKEGLASLTPSEVHWVDPSDLHGWVNAFHKLNKREIPPASLSSQRSCLEHFSTLQMGQSMDAIYRNVLGLNA